MYTFCVIIIVSGARLCSALKVSFVSCICCMRKQQTNDNFSVVSFCKDVKKIYIYIAFIADGLFRLYFRVIHLVMQLNDKLPKLRGALFEIFKIKLY